MAPLSPRVFVKYVREREPDPDWIQENDRGPERRRFWPDSRLSVVDDALGQAAPRIVGGGFDRGTPE